MDLNEYAVLGLSSFASKTDVKFAYKRLASKVHFYHAYINIKSAYEILLISFFSLVFLIFLDFDVDEEQQMDVIQLVCFNFFKNFILIYHD